MCACKCIPQRARSGPGKHPTHMFSAGGSGHPLLCTCSCLCPSPLLFIRAGISFISTTPETCVRACRGLLVGPFPGRASHSRVACACNCCSPLQPLVGSAGHVPRAIPSDEGSPRVSAIKRARTKSGEMHRVHPPSLLVQPFLRAPALFGANGRGQGVSLEVPLRPSLARGLRPSICDQPGRTSSGDKHRLHHPLFSGRPFCPCSVG